MTRKYISQSLQKSASVSEWWSPIKLINDRPVRNWMFLNSCPVYW